MRFLVIDGGGTSTDVAVCDGVSIAARSSLPTVKPAAGNPKTDELCRMLGSFLATSPVDHTEDAPLHALVIGMAGIWSDAERYSYRQALRDAWQTYVSPLMIPFVVMSDAELALTSAHGNGQGAILIAGTGSIMLMRDSEQHLHRCGGWGPLIDDAGSGYWLGRQACTAVARMLDGRGPATQLIRPVAAYLRVDSSDHNAVRNALRTTSTPAFARIGSAVLQYADELDAVALDIREEGARELALLLSALEMAADVTVYGSLMRNDSFRMGVERYSGRALTLLDDVVASLVDKIGRADTLPPALARD